jgi:hypothetical protein
LAEHSDLLQNGLARDLFEIFGAADRLAPVVPGEIKMLIKPLIGER